MNYRTKEFRVWTFGGVTYTRKQDVIDKFRQVKSGDSDLPFMSDLLSRHPDHRSTVVSVSFEPHVTSRFGDLGMVVKLENGDTWLYPSYKPCLVPDEAMRIDGGADWHRQYYAAKEPVVLRGIIQYQLDEFRQGRITGDARCDFCGVETIDGDVDHIVPFDDVYRRWMEHHSLCRGDLVFDTISDDGLKKIKDDVLNDSWDVFHQENFDPQWLCKPCHRSKK